MEENASNIYGPIFSLILQLKNAPKEKQDSIIQQLCELNEQTRKKLIAFDDEFLNLKNSRIELNEKIKMLNEVLDRKMARISEDDMMLSRARCEIIYGNSWRKLDVFSQQYLIMANYLYKLFSKNDADFSPAVVEFGRAIENELLKKIYSGYISSLSEQTTTMIDSGHIYGDLKAAVRNYKNNHGEFYISPRIMVRYLSYLSDEEIENAYNEALKEYLKANSIDKYPISEHTFTSDADILFDQYRNTAAHPGSVIELVDASECRNKSEKVLKTFMQAVQ